MNQQNVLDQRLRDFRKKYYTDKIVRGSLILALLISSMLFVALLSEGLFGFSSTVRTTIVVGLGVLFVGILGYMVIWPVTQLFNLSRTISDYQIAEMVKKYFPEQINDKLINLLQLKQRNQDATGLAAAAINKKTNDIAPVQLSSAINLKLNNKYLKYLSIPLVLFLITYFADPSLLSSSSHRLINIISSLPLHLPLI